MPCKVASTSDHVDAVQWKSLSSGASAPSSRVQPAQQAFSKTSPGDDPVLLRDRIAELDRIRQTELAQAKQQGFHEGIQQGRNQAVDEVKAAGEKVAQTLAELASVKRKLRNEAELELLKLSLSIARRILHRELSTDPEALHGLVHTALQKLQNREISRVRVYPGGAESVKVSLERIGAAPAIQVLPDPSLKNGDLIFETSFGELDASVDSQLQEIQRGFADRLSLK